MDEIDKLQKIKDLLNDGKADATEVAEIFGMLMKVMSELKSHLIKEIGDMDSEMKEKHSEMYAEMEEMMSEVKKMLDKKIGKEECMKMMKEHESMMEEIKDSIPTMPDLSDIEKRLRDQEVKEMPKFPIEALNERFQELQTALEEAREEIKKVKETPRTIVGGSRRVFQPYRDDLSASCDGANKTFYLSRAPLNDVIMVYGTDFPQILRPTIDFTIANKTLTLTAAIPAPSEGATLLVTYFS